MFLSSRLFRSGYTSEIISFSLQGKSSATKPLLPLLLSLGNGKPQRTAAKNTQSHLLCQHPTRTVQTVRSLSSFSPLATFLSLLRHSKDIDESPSSTLPRAMS